MTFREALVARQPILGDAAVGTEIHRRGGITRLPLWSAQILLDDPHMLEQIHKDHLAAGADYITLNTFRTQQHVLALKNLGERCETLTAEAYRRARRAVDTCGRPAWILGSMSPLEDCYRPDLTPDNAILLREHRRHARALASHKIDGILLETFSHRREIRIAFAEARATGLPVVISLCCTADGRTLAGDSLHSLVRDIENALEAPDAWAINCLTPQEMTAAHRKLKQATNQPTGAWAHVGHEDEIHGWCESGLMDAEAYGVEAGNWLADGATLVGGCCGTNAAFLSAVRNHWPAKLSQILT